MKTYKFIFNFIDFDLKKRTLFCIDACLDGRKKWQDTGDLVQYLEWIEHYAVFKYSLQKLISVHVKNLMTGTRNGHQSKISTMFLGYRLKSIKSNKEDKIVNLNESETPAEFMPTHYICTKKFKYIKGGGDHLSHTDVYSYLTETHHQHFRIQFRDKSNFELLPMTDEYIDTFTIGSDQVETKEEKLPPVSSSSSPPISAQNGSSKNSTLYVIQEGGDDSIKAYYDHKKKKYEKKYIKLAKEYHKH